LNAAVIMQTALSLAIFVLLYVACKEALEWGIDSFARRMRLREPKPIERTIRKSHAWSGWLRFGRLSGLHRHIADVLDTMNMKTKVSTFVTVSAILGLLGIGTGAYVFQSVKGAMMLGAMTAVMPYAILRMRLVTRQMRSRLEFLPAVETFYQYYLMSETRNIRLVLARCLEERRLRMPVRASFELLHRHLSTNRMVDDALRIFAFSLGHVWGKYLTNLLRVGLTEGADLSDSLHDLIMDMRQAQAADQAARNKLLEIRVASFSPPVFLALFLMVNFHMSGSQAYHYYFVDPEGRNMLLNGIVLMFGSFVMGLWLSIRRM